MMSTKHQGVDQEPHPGLAPDHKGTAYTEVLMNLHEWLVPANYFEIGTGDGYSLCMAKCAAIAVDAKFILGTRDFIGEKPFCSLYQMSSDAFFSNHDPTLIFDGPIELAFLDGMHHCEYLLRDFANTERYCRRSSVIVMHDCVPVETAIANQSELPPISSAHEGWWTGDVWRTLLALRKHRPDLAFTVLDSFPTGLVLVTNLDPQSTDLMDGYAAIVREMKSLSLEQIGLEAFFSMINLESTSVIETKEKMAEKFSL
jgi:hypothetical protein